MDALIKEYKTEKGEILDKTFEAVKSAMTDTTKEILEKGYSVNTTEDAQVLKALLETFSNKKINFAEISKII